MATNGNASASVSPIENRQQELIPPDDFVEELRSLTLDELVGSVSEVARLMEYPDEAFDPESIVGELILNPDSNEEMRSAIRRKIDHIHHVISEFDAYAAREEIRAKRHQLKSQRSRRRAQLIRDRVKFTLESNQFQKLSGNDYVAKLTENTLANCSLVFDREPDAADMLQYDFVEEIPATYAWKNKEVKDQLKEFYKATRGQPNCELCNGKKTIISDDMIINCHQCCGTGISIPDDVEIPLAVSVAYLQWNPKVIFDDIDRPEVSEKKPRKKKAGK